MKRLPARLKLTADKLTALFILKMAYSRAAQLLFGLFSVVSFLLFAAAPKPIWGLCFALSSLPLVGGLLMKPFDDIIVISRVTGSPHVLIRNREVIGACFEGSRLNTIRLLKLIKRSMFRFLYAQAVRSKRRAIITYTHETMFKNLGLGKLGFITDVEEIRPGTIRDRLLFVSLREIWEREDLSDLLRKVPYYRFKIDIGLLKEYVSRNPLDQSR